MLLTSESSLQPLTNFHFEISGEWWPQLGHRSVHCSLACGGQGANASQPPSVTGSPQLGQESASKFLVSGPLFFQCGLLHVPFLCVRSLGYWTHEGLDLIHTPGEGLRKCSVGW